MSGPSDDDATRTEGRPDGNSGRLSPAGQPSRQKGSTGKAEVVASSQRSKLASILIVEDDALVGSYIEMVLAESGFAIVGIAASAAEAQSLTDERHPDLALVDIGLTGPIDGIELACLLRAKFNVPAVFLTGDHDRETELRAQVARPLGYLAKPVLPSAIFAAIEQALEQIRQGHAKIGA